MGGILAGAGVAFFASKVRKKARECRQKLLRKIKRLILNMRF